MGGQDSKNSTAENDQPQPHQDLQDSTLQSLENETTSPEEPTPLTDNHSPTLVSPAIPDTTSLENTSTDSAFVLPHHTHGDSWVGFLGDVAGAAITGLIAVILWRVERKREVSREEKRRMEEFEHVRAWISLELTRLKRNVRIEKARIRELLLTIDGWLDGKDDVKSKDLTSIEGYSGLEEEFVQFVDSSKDPLERLPELGANEASKFGEDFVASFRGLANKLNSVRRSRRRIASAPTGWVQLGEMAEILKKLSNKLNDVENGTDQLKEELRGNYDKK